MPSALTRFKWERALMSKRGPQNSTSRLVGLVMSTHTDGKLMAYPSTRLLAQEAGLSERAVIEHVNSLVDLGWLKRAKHKGAGKKWRQSFYWLTNPQATDGRSSAKSEAAYPASAAKADKLLTLTHEAAYPDDNMLITQGQSNEPMNTLLTLKEQGSRRRRLNTPAEI